MDAIFRDTAGAQQTQVIAAAVVVIVTVFLLFWISRKRALQRRRLPPGPKGWPVLGSLLSLGTLPHRNLRELSKRYGPIMFMHLGSVPTLVVSNASMAKEILKTNDQIMASRPDQIITTYMTYNRQDVGFAPYGPIWRQARKICTLQLLTASRISQFQGMRERETRSMVQAIMEESRKGNILHMNEYLGDLTMNIMTQMMWNKKYRGIKRESSAGDHDGDEFVKLMRDNFALVASNNLADYLPGPTVFKSSLMVIQGLEKQMKIVHKKLDSFFSVVIREHQENKLHAEEQNPSDADDFINVLLRLSKSGEFDVLSPEMMKGILRDMLTGGTDTTAVTMEWALAELVKHPTVLTQLQDELNSVVGPDRLVSPEDIPNLTYLRAVVKESFRLHPAAPLLIPHQSTQGCEIGKYHIPANTLVFINVFAIHRDPAFYERPEEFNPDRFLHSAKDIDFKGQDFELIPFGSGRRMCPAMNLGSATVHLGLAQLLHAFTWTLPEGEKPEELDMSEVFGLSVAKSHPLRVLAKPRLRDDVFYPESLYAVV